MLVLDRQPAAGSPSGDSLEVVRLRLMPGGQVMELPRGKTTIGSSPRCNVRIQEPGVQPLHCLILNAGQGLMVRRWAGETSLNGRRLEESSLAVGDRLQVGSVELELVRANDRVTTPVAKSESPKSNDVASAAFGLSSASVPGHAGAQNASKPAPNQVTPLANGRDAARARSRKLLAALRRDRAAQIEAGDQLTKLRRQLEAISAQRDAATTAEREAEEQLMSLRREVERNVAQRDSAADELLAVSQELAALRKRVKEQESAILAYQPMAVQNEKLARKAETLEARVVEITAQLETAESARLSLTEKDAALSAEARFVEAENTRLKHYGEELAQRNCELLGERDELRGQVDQLEMKLQWLDGEKAELQSTVGTLEGEKSRLEYASREHSDKLSNLYAELERAAAENAQLSQSLEEHTNRSAVAGSERDELHRRVDELQTNLKWVSGEKTALESERDNLRRRVDELQGNLQSVASEKSRIESEFDEVATQVGESSAEREHLAAENDRLQKLVEELRNETSSLCTHRDQLSGQVGDLQSRTQSLAEEKAALETTGHELRAELNSFREQTERLERELATTTSEKAVAAAECATLATECERLRSEYSNVADLEQRLNSALADREHTSSELYRALVQLSEMQERDDNRKNLAAAHDAINEALEKSMREVAELTEQIERLSAQHAEAEAARLELAQQQSATAEAQVRYANEKASLDETADELRAELMEACEREAKYVAQLRAAEEWRQKYEAAARNESALAKSLAELESRLVGKQQSDDEAASLAADREQKVADYERLLAEASESIGQLQQELAEAVEARRNVELSRDLWENERAGWRQQQAEFQSQIADLKAELVESLEALAAERTRVDEVPTSDETARESSKFRTEADSASASVALRYDSLDEELHESKAEADQSISRPGPFDRVVRERETTQDSSVAASPQTSYIEQYSHMFDDDKPSVDSPVASPVLRSPLPEEHSQPPRNQTSLGGNAAPPSSDDDESIEQYMAKLMQRVRGDSAPAAAPVKPSTTVHKPGSSGPLGYESSPIQPERPMSLSAISLRDSVTAGDATPSDAPLRRSSMPAPQTDLEALRALANESARRAISRHSIRKYRRNATTKVIVSTLAAMTSVWLMLESPNWTHWQFLAACGIILIAVYWTGRTLRALLETVRAATPDETEKEIREISAELQARLPVDVLDDTTPAAT